MYVGSENLKTKAGSIRFTLYLPANVLIYYFFRKKWITIVPKVNNINLEQEILLWKEHFETYSNLFDKNIEGHLTYLLKQKIHFIPLADTDQFNAKSYFKLLSNIASCSSSLALSFAMHLYTLWGLKYILNDKQKKFYFSDVINNNSLFSSLNEPGLHFVNSKNINKDSYPLVATINSEGNYQINGSKKFVSLEPFVKYLPIYALIYNEYGEYLGINAFIIDKNTCGVSIKNSWDTIAMKETYSNDIIFNNVTVSKDCLIFDNVNPFGEHNMFGILYYFSISCVYFGMAQNAFDYICKSCQKKQVPHSNLSLSRFPGVQFTISEMLILKETMYSQIEHLCNLIDTYLNSKETTYEFDKIDSISLITKEYVTTSAEKIINKAMKIEGISSISNNNPLSRLYLDVKAGQFHPPQKDIIYEILAKRQLGIISVNNRWC